VPGPLAMIVVHADYWFAAGPTDRTEYVAAAQSRGIILANAGGAAVDVLVVVREGNPHRSTEAVFYSGFVGCSRSPWEHEVRQLLSLEDPCFVDY
jgi:hypothetical protein